MGVSQRLQSAINSIIGDPQANIDLVALLNAAAGGTITSAGLSMPSIFSVANSPITSSGTFTVTLNTQVKNLVYAGPVSGGNATPTFRAFNNLDLPNSISLVTSVAAPNVTLSGLSGSNLIWNTDGAGSIGTNAANRPRDIFSLGGINLGSGIFPFGGGTIPGAMQCLDASTTVVAFIQSNADGINVPSGQPPAQLGFFDAGGAGTGPVFGYFGGGMTNLNNAFSLYNTGDAAGPFGGFYEALKFNLPANASPPYNGVTLLWGGDGNGDIGAVASGRPNNIYAKAKVIATAGLGVGNSAAATTPGTVIKKIQVFDASGASLGFVAVYDAIA